MPTALPTASTLHAALVSARGRASQRTLDLDDIAAALAAHALLLGSSATDDDVEARTTLRGGFVPNGYKYRAESDEVRIVSRRVDGTWTTTATASRARASSRSHGSGELCIHRLLRAGQVDGRVVSL